MQNRKTDHIELAKASRVGVNLCDSRFYYEPLFVDHGQDIDISCHFLGKSLAAPIWISSMTGGTQFASDINKSLAAAANRFGLGMALGSLRPILCDPHVIADFDVRKIVGENLPLMGNLGIAQIEELLLKKELSRLSEIVEILQLDGICIHINPLQEWFQLEGDYFTRSPLATLKQFLEEVNYKVIVKEVGQGMGPKSLKALMELPLAAIEFGAFGGTNFSKIELMRQGDDQDDPMIQVGHGALEMVRWCNDLVDNEATICREFIISGGVMDYLDGYYLMEKLQGTSIYGQAGVLIEAVKNGKLEDYLKREIEGLKMAKRCLVVR